jgi:hypothetical protein
MRAAVALAAALALGILHGAARRRCAAGDEALARRPSRIRAYPTAAKDLEAFRHRLRDLGYVEGKNLVIESRSAESGFERLPELAAKLVGLKVDVIAGVRQQDDHGAEGGDADDILAAGGGR